MKKFIAYFLYKIDIAAQQSNLKLILILIIVSLIGIFFFSSLYYVLVKLNISSYDNSISNVFWDVFKLFFDQNKILDIDLNKNTYLDIFFKFNVTIFGILIFSTLIAILTNSLIQFANDLREGKTKIRDANHIIICNYSSKVTPLLKEIFELFKNKKKTVVIISNFNPNYVLSTIKESVKIPKNINFIARQGYGWQENILETVNLGEADKILILNPNLDKSFNNEYDLDTEVAKTLISIRTSQIWQQKKPPIICEFIKQDISSTYDRHFIPLPFAEKFYELWDHTSINITTAQIKSKLIAQSVNTPEVSEVFDKLFGFSESEIYFYDYKFKKYEEISKKFSGKNIQEINLFLNHIIIIGFFAYEKDNIDFKPSYFLNPNNHFLFNSGYGFICIAKNFEDIEKDFLNSKLNNIKKINPKLISNKQKESLALINLNSDNKNEILELILDIYDVFNNDFKKITIYQENPESLKIIQDEIKKVIESRIHQSNGYDYSTRYSDILEPSYIHITKDYHNLGLQLKFDRRIFFDELMSGYAIIRKDRFGFNHQKNNENKNDDEILLTVASINPLSYFINHIKPGDIILDITDQENINNSFEKSSISFKISNWKKGYINFIRDRISEFLEKKKNFYLIVKESINGQIKQINVKPEILFEHQKKMIENFSLTFEKNKKIFSNILNNITVEKLDNDQLLFSEEQVYQSHDCRIIINKKNNIFSDYKNENPIYDNKVFNHHIKLSTLYTGLTIQNGEKNFKESLITEVNNVKTKTILDKIKFESITHLYGMDIIDLNTLISKGLSSAINDIKNIDLINLLFEQKINFFKQHIVEENIVASFSEFEKYFYNINETLIGFINYESIYNDKHNKHYLGRKIKKIVINPDQTENIKFNVGDKLITISDYNYYDKIKEFNYYSI